MVFGKMGMQVLSRFVVSRIGGSYWNPGFGFNFSVSLLSYTKIYTNLIFLVVSIFHSSLMRGRSCFEFFNKQRNKLQEFSWLVIDRRRL